MQTIEYGATNSNGQVYHAKHSTTTLAKLERPFIQRGQTDSLNNISFVVPQVLSSRHDGIIKIKHSVEVCVYAVNPYPCPHQIHLCPIFIYCTRIEPIWAPSSKNGHAAGLYPCRKMNLKLSLSLASFTYVVNFDAVPFLKQLWNGSVNGSYNTTLLQSNSFGDQGTLQHSLQSRHHHSTFK